MMRFFESEGARLAYHDEGHGPALVLLHAGFLDHHMWDDQIPFFARDHRVIAPDVRGHGESSNADLPFRQTDDLAALLRHLGTGPAALIGISMGAGIAVDTALEHPELVRAVVVGGAGTSEPYFEQPWSQEVLGRWNAALAAGDVEAWLAAFQEFTAGPHRKLEEVDERVVRRIGEMARHTVSKHTMDEPDHLVPVTGTWTRAVGIEAPVLAVNGSLDSEDHIGMARRLADTVPHGRVATIEGAAHYPNMEHPEAFNEVVARFLRR